MTTRFMIKIWLLRKSFLRTFAKQYDFFFFRWWNMFGKSKITIIATIIANFELLNINHFRFRIPTAWGLTLSRIIGFGMSFGFSESVRVSGCVTSTLEAYRFLDFTRTRNLASHLHPQITQMTNWQNIWKGPVFAKIVSL